jgi:hypothetical protein
MSVEDLQEVGFCPSSSALSQTCSGYEAQSGEYATVLSYRPATQLLMAFT